MPLHSAAALSRTYPSARTSVSYAMLLRPGGECHCAPMCCMYQCNQLARLEIEINGRTDTSLFETIICHHVHMRPRCPRALVLLAALNHLHCWTGPSAQDTASLTTNSTLVLYVLSSS